MASHQDLDMAIVIGNTGDWGTQFRQTLAECALEVLMASDEEHAIHIAQGIIARLVVLHIPASNTRALDTCARLRNIPGYSPVPIVLVGTPYSTGERADAAQLGALRLALPISIMELKQAIFPLLGAAPPQPGISAEWKRRHEPRPAFGEPRQLARGSRLLGLYRRGTLPQMSRRTDWFR